MLRPTGIMGRNSYPKKSILFSNYELQLPRLDDGAEHGIQLQDVL